MKIKTRSEDGLNEVTVNVIDISICFDDEGEEYISLFEILLRRLIVK